jgi:hypothetical protein
VSAGSIAFVIPHPYVDALACFREPIRRLADEGWRVDLYTALSPAHPAPFFGRDEIRLVPIETTRAGVIALVAALVRRRPKYRWIVTVPQWGLHYAGLAGRLAGIAVGCISDELKAQSEARTPMQKRWAARERRAHRRCRWTIALSEERAAFVREDAGLGPDHDVFVVPNGAPGPARRIRSRFYQDTLAIPDDEWVVLYAGSWWWKQKPRFARLEEIAAGWSAGTTLVFQGRLVSPLRVSDGAARIRVSPTVLPAALLDHAVSSAHVGLALYDDVLVNDQLMGTASGKLLLYLKNGLPVIANAHRSLEWIEREGCGLLVNDLSEIEAAAAAIRRDYGRYVERATRFYDERLDFDKTFAPVARRLAEDGGR